jgi:succinate-semialdehyde dehydrogenase / glutarate-semialdehyde dehydrogenase
MPTLKDQSLIRNQCYIGGRWMDAQSGRIRDIVNPADGSIVGSVPICGSAETRAAIEAALKVFPQWRAQSATERSQILYRWYQLMMENQEDLALILTCEQGKPLQEAKGEIHYAASFVQWFAEESRRIYGDVIPSTSGDRRFITLKEPVGVCAAITPWNFPSAMITRKVAPALAAGCTVISKPAGQTPLSALALAVLAERAGMPAGVLNVIVGDTLEIGNELTSNPAVRKLSFTGSTEVGRFLMAQCAPTLKKLSLELGGNAPFIVFEDADLDAAVDGAMASKFRNSGQTCVCANRFLVQDGVYDLFAEKLKDAVSKLKVGNGLDADSTQGPLINETAVAKVEQLINDALVRGGWLMCGGKRHALGGNYFQPTILADVTPDMRVSREEIFGPVVPLIRFQNDSDAIRLANDTEFGLAAYFFARDLRRAWCVAEALECGMIGINTGMISSAVTPFGGVKSSGMGREGSKYGIDEYVQIKFLCVGGLPPGPV